MNINKLKEAAFGIGINENEFHNIYVNSVININTATTDDLITKLKLDCSKEGVFKVSDNQVRIINKTPSGNFVRSFTSIMFPADCGVYDSCGVTEKQLIYSLIIMNLDNEDRCKALASLL